MTPFQDFFGPLAEAIPAFMREVGQRPTVILVHSSDPPDEIGDQSQVQGIPVERSYGIQPRMFRLAVENPRQQVS